jgi:hypothetical protein
VSGATIRRAGAALPLLLLQEEPVGRAAWAIADEFPQLEPVKRRGNRRYYQPPVLSGARNRLIGDDAQVDVNQSRQFIHQMRLELEEQ